MVTSRDIPQLAPHKAATFLNASRFAIYELSSLEWGFGV